MRESPISPYFAAAVLAVGIAWAALSGLVEYGMYIGASIGVVLGVLISVGLVIVEICRRFLR